MCGITGIFNYKTGKPVDKQIIRRMTDKLAHRGPDGQGYYYKNHIGLGHRRLSVIDLSDRAGQPMASPDGTVWLVFNGEIYNFPELRKSLEAKYDFQTRSDTEVLLACYLEYGPDCLQYLRGMFALAVYDSTKDRLFLARDRLGKKPLVYHLSRDGIIFASEIKAILEVPGVNREIDPTALDQYLARQFVPHPKTMFKGISKLPPGHALICERGQTNVYRYWDINYSTKRNLTFEEAEVEVYQSLSEAVQCRLISDVPLGVMLSGGLDSSLVTAVMAQLGHRPVKTFSVSFAEEDYNEADYARMVADRYQTDHHELLVQPNALAVLPKIVWHLSEPMADSSILPTFWLAQQVRQEVTVALNGDGGDELCCGYGKYRIHPLAAWWHRLPRGIRERIRSQFRRLVNPGKGGQGPLHRIWTGLLFPEARSLYFPIFFTPERKLGLYREGLIPSVFNYVEDTEELLAQAEAASSNVVEKILYIDTHTYLPDDLLVKMDIAAMAHGLETRSPFLDHRMIELTASLPVDYKVSRGRHKRLLKSLAKRLLPPEVIHRSKQGFAIPLDTWFRGGFGLTAKRILEHPAAGINEFFRPESVTQLFQEHLAGRVNHGHRLWMLLILEIWLAIFFHGFDPQAPLEQLRP
ncbi:MAG: asparagine synthase (glutamine-hydrolyzing) [Deltaproteobacteria bacterium]|nr:asparagine synthase (glutamine-hydrolyzing) [Deltaproteobacteria bacterium]